MIVNYAGLGIIAVAIIFVLVCFFVLKNKEEGTEEMIDIAKIIRDGSWTFLKTEYFAISIVVLIVAVVLTLFVEKTVGITFIVGAIASSTVCLFGMATATYGNVRTANAARLTGHIGKTVQVALMGGAATGIPVQAISLLGLILIPIITGGIQIGAKSTGIIPIFEVNPTIMRMSTYALGCSLVAMFNRVAGGNYTKAADISADIVAKVRHDMPEDDSRMPNTVADFIGDNVNDIAGNCSDLLESFTATVVSTLMIATMIATDNQEMFKATITYPILLAGGGLLACLIGLAFVLLHKASENPSRELNIATYISAILTIAIGGVGSWWLFGNVQTYDSFIIGWASPWVSSILGIISGVMIGKITEYYTSTDFKPVKGLAKSAVDGDAFLVTLGDAIGSQSVLIPVFIIGLSLLISGKISGIYGIAVASLGMLSFVATTVSIDAFGPIADNAGGIAESCHLPHEVRTITDKLDAVGNTTAAIGKGFAIGSAAFATVSLIFAFVGSYSKDSAMPDLNIASFIVVAGALIGGALVEYFAALLTKNTIWSAHELAAEGDRQLSVPGVIEGKVRPNYEKCISMAAKNALAKMVMPSIIALIIPVVAGLLFGPEFVGGILIGATIVAIPRAIFMGNSGGAFDNAKKFIEEGLLEGWGKGTSAHKAAVVGDTIGDTRKDVVGVALDIFIKTMSTVANTIAPIILIYHLF